MPRKESKVVPGDNNLVPWQEEFGSDQPTLADLYRIFEEKFDRQLKIMKSHLGKFDTLAEDWRSMNQRLLRLEHDARQPRLAMEADGPVNTKTRERTEGVAKTVQEKHGDSCTAQRVQDKPKILTCFSVMAEPPALPCRDDVVVENGAAAPKSYLPSLEMRSPTAAGGLLPTGETSTATKITFSQPPLRLYLTEETNWRTSTQPVSYDSSFWKYNVLAVPSCRRIIETKSGEYRTFDPGGSGSSPCLPVFDIVARVALWGGSC